MKIKTIVYMGLFQKDLFETKEVVDQSIHGNLELFGVSLSLSLSLFFHLLFDLTLVPTLILCL
jgi:hypothetical protein